MQTYFHIPETLPLTHCMTKHLNLSDLSFLVHVKNWLVCDIPDTSQLLSGCNVCNVAQTPSSLCHFIPVSGDTALF